MSRSTGATRRGVTAALGLVSVAALCGCATGGGGRVTSSPPPSITQSMTHTSSGVATVAATNLLVVGDVPASRLRQVARDGTLAVRQVVGLWGRSWLNQGPFRVEVPPTTGRFLALGGDGSQVAATTTPQGTIVLNPEMTTRLTTAGRRAVLAHELTHVALHQYAEDPAPRWVIEGSAEVTAYRGFGLSLARAAPAVVRAVRAGKSPQGPPTDAALEATSTDLQSAYQQAYAWCTFLVHRFGTSSFVRFVRMADRGLSDAFEVVFQATPAGLSSAYRSWLEAQATGLQTKR